jgi:hypothetical protein
MKAEAWDICMRAMGYPDECPEAYARILGGIRVGVSIDFEGDRFISRTCVNLLISAENEPKVNAIILADVQAGKKAGPFDAPPFTHTSCSPIGCVEKAEAGKIRVIHHLSHPYGGDSINASTLHVDQEMGSFDQACEFIRSLGAGCYLVKLDVEAAYKQVPVRPEDWPLLGFKWRGKWYYERVLPFGLKSSCRLWELYATALHRMFERQLGIKCVVHYVDDFLFVVKELQTAQRQLAAALRHCAQLGLPMAAEKTLGPATQLTFLGIELDTITLTARLSEERLGRLHSLLMDWIGRTHATITQLASLEGVLSWCTKVVRPGRSFLARIRAWRKDRRLRGEGPHALTTDVLKDVDWWLRFGREWNGVSVMYDVHWQNADKLELFTDACETGFGASWGNSWLYGRFNPVQLSRANKRNKPGKRSISFLELLALVLAAAAWGDAWRGKKIRFRSDSTNVCFALRSRNSPVQRLMELVRHLATLAAKHQFDFDCVHIPGVLNVAADRLSRGDLPGFFKEVPTADPQPTPVPLLPRFSDM